MPPLTAWSEAGSTLYWSSGCGLLTEPLELESGTLNCTTLPPLMQCPAVPKQPQTSSSIQAVQPTFIRRALNGSLESTRSSLPQIDSCTPLTSGVSPTTAWWTDTRFRPVPGCALSST